MSLKEWLLLHGHHITDAERAVKLIRLLPALQTPSDLRRAVQMLGDASYNLSEGLDELSGEE